MTLLHDFKATSIDGEEVSLDEYAGDVVLVVNTASECGYTPQLGGLETLYETYRARGLTVLGFPCNQFGGQDPGSDDEIGAFCQKNYGVTFPMFSKISVKGADLAPLYQFLTHQPTAPQPSGNITWNFEKFLIGRDGQTLARYAPKTQPADAKLVEAIETALGQ